MSYLIAFLILTAAPDLEVRDAQVSRFDQLWATRDGSASSAELERLAEAFSAPPVRGADPAAAYERLWRATRWEVWLATGEVAKDEVRRHAQAGRKAGELARRLKPDGLEAKYWTALCVGLYASAIPTFEAMGLDLDEDYRLPLEEVLRADAELQRADLDYVGPAVALASYLWRVPWPEQDRHMALQLFDRALLAHPDSLRARFLLADAVREKDREAARRELARVVAAAPTEDRPDARRYKHQAEELLAKLH